MIDEQSSASGHDYVSDRSAIGAGHRVAVVEKIPHCDLHFSWDNFPFTKAKCIEQNHDMAMFGRQYIVKCMLITLAFALSLSYVAVHV